MIMKIMPVFLPVISFGLPAGLVLYFAVSNLYRVGQQWFISRSIYGIKRGDLPLPAPDPAGRADQGFFASLKEQFSPTPTATPDRRQEAGREPRPRAARPRAAAKPTAKPRPRPPAKKPAEPAKAAKAPKTPRAKASRQRPASSGRTSGRVTPSKAAASQGRRQPTSRPAEPQGRADDAAPTAPRRHRTAGRRTGRGPAHAAAAARKNKKR